MTLTRSLRDVPRVARQPFLAQAAQAWGGGVGEFKI